LIGLFHLSITPAAFYSPGDLSKYKYNYGRVFSDGQKLLKSIRTPARDLLKTKKQHTTSEGQEYKNFQTANEINSLH